MNNKRITKPKSSIEKNLDKSLNNIVFKRAQKTIKPVTGELKSLNIVESPLYVIPRISQYYPDIKNIIGVDYYENDNDTLPYDQFEFERDFYGFTMPLMVSIQNGKAYEISQGIEIPVINYHDIDNSTSVFDFINQHPVGILIRHDKELHVDPDNIDHLRVISSYIEEMKNNKDLSNYINEIIRIANQCVENHQKKHR